MFRVILKSKIHHAHVTQSNPRYEGSITIDRAIMRAADLVTYERVQVSSVNTGRRLETYVIEGEEGSGIIGMNGAAAKLVGKGEVIHILSYVWLKESARKKFKSRVVHLDKQNHIKKVSKDKSR